ncbi:methylglyoxal reductase (NADPH-dependent) gre2 [Maudiozyma exigua]|uniref:Methylglyoxal reductase (NADPH-dependent) gre2 n=1 Tax=Maudiozyma exigua TaxID=34358 RepID=A0A9P6W5R0_MAUEX|nr:methylglyoxal reductase (NADPH-dependent) gre2 [Kazachstania exigua]
MKGLLNCIEKHGKDSFENLVMTSGLLVLIDPLKMGDSSMTFNEDSWNPVTWDSSRTDFINAIAGAKKTAEQMGWDFYQKNKNTTKLKFTAIIPSNILGPQLFDEDVHEHLNASNEVVNQLMHATEIGDISPFANRCVHVEDVAKAHVLSLDNNSPMVGNRIIVSTSNFNSQDILNYLNDDFDILRANIPVGERSDSIENISIGAKIDSTKSQKLLNFKLKSLKDCIDDTASQVLRHDGKL